jgi:hypothetical protein
LGQLDGPALEAGVKRVIVLGGLGGFGRAIVGELERLGVAATAASRRGAADLRIDAEDGASIRAALRPGDLVIDAAGPYHLRSTVLVEAAIEIGFDVIDLNDYLAYADRLVALRPRIEASGISVLSSASTVSAIAAATVQRSGFDSPVRLSGFLAPSSRQSANPGAALSLLRSVGQPITIWRDGRRQTVTGWSEPQRFAMPAPLGTISGRLYETADAAYLPQVWPTLREATMRVAPNVAGLTLLLSLAARWPWVRNLLQRQIQFGARFTRRFGSPAGGVGYEIEDASGRFGRWAIVAAERGYLVAIAPAVLAARAIAEERFRPWGLMLPDEHMLANELAEYLATAGIEWRKLSG